jgi:cation diffusion facilitator CzcD-associated flavoprotein CzcO/short-subunit dehydrogenase
MEISGVQASDAEIFDVLIVGAGLSGIDAAYRLREKNPGLNYVILENRERIGGTWDLFTYPGVRSDSDIFTLSFPWNPWKGDRLIAEGHEIRQYLEDSARDFGIMPHIRFGTEVLAANFDTTTDLWTVDVRTDGEPATYQARFLYGCTGYYRYDTGYLPEFPGVDDYTGTLVHPQFWPADLDYAGKKVVVVIGSGATAITLVPALAEQDAHVTMLQRSPSWVASIPTIRPGDATLRRLLPARSAAWALRWGNALRATALFQASKKRPAMVRRGLRRRLEQELPDDIDIDTHFTPDYDPWDQRLCLVADGDLFAALRSRRASVVTGHIERFTADGLALAPGARGTSGDEVRHLPADVVVTATGLELLFLGGIELSVDGEEVDVTERLTYRNMALEGVPNLALVVGYANASWTLRADLTCAWVARLLDHLHTEGLTTCIPVNHGAVTTAEPLLGLRSGYMLRAVDRFPKQGSDLPWRSPQNYLSDRRDLGSDPLHLDALELTRAPGAGGAHPSPGAVGSPRVEPATEAERDRGPFAGKVAAITGAASGIGQALAEALARQGAHLALVDVDEDGLAATAERCEGHGVKVRTRVVDVADADQVQAWADAVIDEFGGVQLVVNNAGVALGATVESMSLEDARWLMDINFWGVVHGTKAFLPHLLAAGEGHIVNVSSVFGLVSIPTQSAYNASKFAVKGFTDALRLELDLADTAVIVRNARFDDSGAGLAGGADERAARFAKAARTSPERAAEVILDGVARKRRRILIGPDAGVFALLARLPTGVAERVILAGARRQARR